MMTLPHHRTQYIVSMATARFIYSILGGAHEGLLAAVLCCVRGMERCSHFLPTHTPLATMRKQALVLGWRKVSILKEWKKKVTDDVALTCFVCYFTEL